ncbi:MAG TPA: type VI secretion system tube protein Hcp [Polyangia bacterium]|nr:type VI secretion system tube protein Hcp [Polyangia bacterium]
MRTICAGALLVLAVSCAGPAGSGGDPELPGKAVLALTGVPADGTCVQITAAGYRTVTRSFIAAAGSNAMFQLSGLPLGQVAFSAAAFDGACPPSADAVPTWISDATFTATVAIKPPVLVTLNLVHNGNATVSVGFDDSADGGAAAGASGGSSGGAAGAGGGSGGSSGGEFMKVPNATGESTAKGFEGWFVLESFDLGLSTAATSGTGAGTGAGKTAWTATASLRFQKGVTPLYTDVATGTHLNEVDFAFEKGGAEPFVYYQVKLKNVIIAVITSGTAHGDELPLLTLTFAFQQIEIEYDPRKPDGSADAAVVIDWDIARNEGGGAAIPELDFAYRGPAPQGFEELTAFRAPSEMLATDPAAGGGAAAGKPVFGDASGTLAIDGTALTMALNEAAGRVIRTAKVEIFDDVTGAPAVFGTYGFENVLITGMTFTGDLDATVTWTAQKLSWTVGDQTGSAGPTP